ncbi:hypothetical protein FHX81_7758 [Saccharothrix saharensis]|uniref:Uncharacterized protein n=1 Tax=Saccharothrix saharensis TaxID=571190 RepID=A0A543JR13_9PSEU|nr:hypothetical protein [Saccharothrix saharensis]TQM85279.1 hypothetical protein FHX81_7758 [Saccharothrix saharensis]
MAHVVRRTWGWWRTLIRKRKVPKWAKSAIGVAVVLVVSTQLDVGKLPMPSAKQRVDCPGEVRGYLAAGSDAELVAAYRTASFDVVICRDGSGTLRYDGRKRNRPVTPDTHIVLPAEESISGYVARNGSTVYRVTASRLTVTRPGEVLVDESATPYSP